MDARGAEDSRGALRVLIALHERIAELCRGVPAAQLTTATQELTADYRASRPGGGRAWGRQHYLAYLVARLPATCGAVESALEQAHTSCPTLSPTSIADLGAGPGTSVVALAHRFPSAVFRLYERDVEFVSLGRRLLEGPSPPTVEYSTTDIASAAPLEPADLVLFSYSFGELQEHDATRALSRAWEATRQMLVVIEPGSPRGYRVVLAARRQLVEAGGHVAAPCPHDSACPVEGSDWCHFASRVPRSQLHRRVKLGALSYEDEKFSYVAVARLPVQRMDGRVIRRPMLRPRVVDLVCCTPRGIAHVAVGKADRVYYRAARDVRWGEAWPSAAHARAEGVAMVEPSVGREHPVVGRQEVRDAHDGHSDQMRDQGTHADCGEPPYE